MTWHCVCVMPASHCFPRANPQAPRKCLISLHGPALCPCCTAPHAGHCVPEGVRHTPCRRATCPCGRWARWLGQARPTRAKRPGRMPTCASLTRLPSYTRGRGDAVPCITSRARPPTLPTSTDTSPTCATLSQNVDVWTRGGTMGCGTARGSRNVGRAAGVRKPRRAPPAQRYRGSAVRRTTWGHP